MKGCTYQKYYMKIKKNILKIKFIYTKKKVQMNHKNLLKIKCITKKQFSIKKGSLKKIKEKKDINQNIKKIKKNI